MVSQRVTDMREGFGHALMPLVAVLWLAIWAAGQLWPASWWFEPVSMSVLDGEPGEPVQMVVTRIIHRPFHAEWYSSVRRVGDFGTEIVCAAAGGGDYRPDARLPDPLDLAWWTVDACPVLPVGRYVLTTTWEVDGGLLFPVKRVRLDSNIFTIGSPVD